VHPFSGLFKRHLLLLLTTLCIGFTLTVNEVQAAPNSANGSTLFDANCARCHKSYELSTGPALYQVANRWGADTTEMKAWIANSGAFMKSGGENADYANALFAEFDGSEMPAFPQFSGSDLTDILAYVLAIPAPPPPGETVAGGGDSSGSGIAPSVLLMIAASLAFLIWMLGKVSFFLRQRVAEQFGEEIPEPIPFLQRPGMKPMFGIGMFVLLSFLGYSVYDGATALGRQQNYMPDQPIAFSHELHAGINKIDCRYCHSGAEKGKSAVIPSLNVCMNCHYDVKKGPSGASGTAEIAKIYKHIGFNAETNAYEGEQEPIEWVRIHNLPDHVYFNHSQHVKVGEIECQTCHGPVEEMEVMYQYEDLSMGWCINCHRETEVQFTSNAFYDGYDELHRKLETGELDAVHVKDIGGTECQKCHY
jgi:mono/diheme cytochrome c family protein